MFRDVVLGVDKDHFERAARGDRKESLGVKTDPESMRSRGRAWSREFKGDRARATGREFPAGRARAARLGDRRGLRFVELASARSTIAASTGSPTIGAPPSTSWRWSSAIMGDDSGTGVAFTRDPNTGERCSSASICATRRARTSSPASARPRRSPICAQTQPESLRAVRRDRAAARTALPRHAGPRVHGRARQALHAADAQRQAQRRGRGQDRARPRRRRSDRQAPSDRAVERAVARPALPRAHRSGTRRYDDRAQGAQRLAGRGAAGKSSSRRRARSRGNDDGQAGDPRARRDDARRRARHDRRRRACSPRRAARPRTPRSSRAAWASRASRGCEALQHRPAHARRATIAGTTAARRRLDHDRRHDRQRRARQARADPAAARAAGRGSRRFSRGPTSCAACEVWANADTPEDARKARAAWARRASACAAPSTCSCSRIACRSCSEMILANDAGSARRGADQAAAVPARRLRRDPRGDGRAIR